MSSVNWEKVKELRLKFVDQNQKARQEDYWDKDLLDSYHKTLGQRISWKWDCVVNEVSNSFGEQFYSRIEKIVDLGCGSGIAHQTFLKGASKFLFKPSELILIDNSTNALKFSRDKITETHEKLPIKTFQRFLEYKPQRGDLLLVSHVINELDERELNVLLEWVQDFEHILWVEAGSHSDSRLLSHVRDRMREGHNILAPCTHQKTCPMLAHEENERHWCHFFAPSPAEVFTSRFWSEFAKNCDVDLSTLPYSFFFASQSVEAPTVGRARVIGYPRVYKASFKALVCEQEGLSDQEFQKRHHPEQFKIAKKKKTLVWLDNRS